MSITGNSKELEIALSREVIDSEPARAVIKESGQNVGLCCQCKKCASGCPVSSFAMDLSPTQIIHALRLGLSDLVLKSDTIWICASCETCTARCPQEIDIARVMDAARIVAQRRKIKPKQKDVVSFYKAVLNNIRRFGRMYELGMIASLKVRTMNFFKDLELGLEMFKRKKFRWIPSRVDTRRIRRIYRKVKEMEKGE